METFSEFSLPSFVVLVGQGNDSKGRHRCFVPFTTELRRPCSHVRLGVGAHYRLGSDQSVGSIDMYYSHPSKATKKLTRRQVSDGTIGGIPAGRVPVSNRGQSHYVGVAT